MEFSAVWGARLTNILKEVATTTVLKPKLKKTRCIVSKRQTVSQLLLRKYRLERICQVYTDIPWRGYGYGSRFTISMVTSVGILMAALMATLLLLTSEETATFMFGLNMKVKKYFNICTCRWNLRRPVFKTRLCNTKVINIKIKFYP